MLSMCEGVSYTTICLGVAIVIAILYWNSVRSHDYWKEKGIPFIKPYPFIGSTFDMFRKPGHEVELERYRKYGRIYGHYEGNQPFLSLGDPALLRDILVKDFHIFQGTRFSSTGNNMMDNMLSLIKGEKWKRIRTIVSPTFSTGKIKKMISILNDCSKTLMKNFKIAAEKNEPIDGKSSFGAFTLDVIASSAFSTKLDSHQDPNNEFVRMARKLLPPGLNWRIIAFLLAPRIMRLFGQTFFSTESMDFFAKVTHKIIEERRKTGQVRNDFLQLLLDINKESDKADAKNQESGEEVDDITSNYGSKQDENLTYKSTASKSLSTDEVISQCVIFFLAGHESTSTTLAHAAYFLAVHPNIQNKAYAEVESVLNMNQGEVTYEALQKMKYLDNVISETLRLYPPAYRTERMAEIDYKLGYTGITIPKGMVITIPIFGIHRDSDFFRNPDEFDPDRFSSRADRDIFAFLPFGAGPKNCVAMRFALLEMKVCLVHLLHSFEVETCEQTKIPLEFLIGQTLLQPKSIILKLKLRNEASTLLD